MMVLEKEWFLKLYYCHLVFSIYNLGSMISSWDSCRYKDLHQIYIYAFISVRMPEDIKGRENLVFKLEMLWKYHSYTCFNSIYYTTYFSTILENWPKQEKEVWCHEVFALTTSSSPGPT